MITLISSLSFIWWFIGIATVAIIIAIESEKEGLASTFFSMVIGLLLWNYSSDILTFVTTNYLEVIGFSVTYILIGIGWSFVKWNNKVKGVFKKLGKMKNDFVTKYGDLSNDDNLHKFNDKISRVFRYSDNSGDASISYDYTLERTIETIKPNVDSYKTIIVAWISYWPLSLIGTLINNPFRQIFNWVYELVSGSYDKFTQNQINNYIK